MFQHHGIDFNFTGDYREYFGIQIDQDGLNYLMLANYLIHEIHPEAITIAEDISGVPTLCRNVNECGMGFDYR